MAAVTKTDGELRSIQDVFDMKELSRNGYNGMWVINPKSQLDLKITFTFKVKNKKLLVEGGAASEVNAEGNNVVVTNLTPG